jgi:hypothetical protein
MGGGSKTPEIVSVGTASFAFTSGGIGAGSGAGADFRSAMAVTCWLGNPISPPPGRIRTMREPSTRYVSTSKVPPP